MNFCQRSRRCSSKHASLFSLVATLHQKGNKQVSSVNSGLDVHRVLPEKPSERCQEIYSIPLCQGSA
jgi:hypothetical protein